MNTRVIVNGAQGKMGSLACETLANHQDFTLVAALTRQDSLREAISAQQADIVVDLTRADSVYENTLTIINSGAHPVIGTSGLQSSQIQYLQSLCKEKRLGGIIVPNFSIGAILMMHFAALTARYFNEVEIIEMHHPQKFDAPSGTAMKTAELIAASRQKPSMANPNGKELVKGARGGAHEGIHIHSLRLPGVLARQHVIFGNTGETLSFNHDSIDRISFMPGLILACQKVSALESLFYGLENLLELQ